MNFVIANDIRLTRDIQIENYVSNIGEFPDYTFVSVCDTWQSVPFSLPLKVNSSTGRIMPCNHNFSVYAIKKSDFGYGLKNGQFWNGSEWAVGGYLEDYLYSVHAKKVIFEIIPHEESFMAIKIKHDYEVDLNKIKTNPDKIVIQTPWAVFAYLIAPFIFLIIILLILLIRRIKK